MSPFSSAKKKFTEIIKCTKKTKKGNNVNHVNIENMIIKKQCKANGYEEGNVVV